MTTYSATHTVLKSHKIAFQTQIDKDYRFVQCVKDIRKGEILLIEHCCIDNMDRILLKGMVRYDEELYNSLYPRTTLWDESTIYSEPLSEDIHDILSLKVVKNCFGEENTCILGNDISRFNHSSTPNATVFRQLVELTLNNEKIKIAFLYVIAVKDIKVNEELYIKYNNTIKFNTEESSTITDFEHMRIDTMPIIDQYMKKSKFAEVATIQYCMYKGLYLSQNQITTTVRFNDYIQSEYNVIPTEDIITQWVDHIRKIFESII